MSEQEQEIAELRARLAELEAKGGATANSAPSIVSAPASAPRKVGFLLGVGIFFLPWIFAWFVLQAGYSTLARIVSLGWLGLVLLVAIGDVGALQSGQATSASVSAPSASVSAPSPPAAAVQPHVLLDVHGSGMKSTESFTTQGDEWRLTYAYNCSNFGMQGNFQVMVQSPSGGLAHVGANELGASGADTDVFHQGGTYYLEVSSECRWHIIVYG